MEFASKNLTAGQLNALVKSLGGENVVRGILDGTTKFVTQPSALLDPNTFFQTRDGLYVWDDFRSRVVAKAEPTAVIPAFKHVELSQNMNDTEIEEMLGDEHLFTETEVCAVVADLISKQESGKKGKLLNNGYANLFYTHSCVVSVHWNAVHRKWCVDAYLRYDHQWHAGLRVFSPATEA